jgi:hypothetical protein
MPVLPRGILRKNMATIEGSHYIMGNCDVWQVQMVQELMKLKENKHWNPLSGGRAQVKNTGCVLAYALQNFCCIQKRRKK